MHISVTHNKVILLLLSFYWNDDSIYVGYLHLLIFSDRFTMSELKQHKNNAKNDSELKILNALYNYKTFNDFCVKFCNSTQPKYIKSVNSRDGM